MNKNNFYDNNKWICIRDYITTNNKKLLTIGKIYKIISFDKNDLIHISSDDGSLTMKLDNYIITDLANDKYLENVIVYRKEKLKILKNI